VKPEQIQIMLHYFCACDDFRNLHLSNIENDIADLVFSDLLSFSVNSAPMYAITAKGKHYVESLLTVPLPRTVYVTDFT